MCLLVEVLIVESDEIGQYRTMSQLVTNDHFQQTVKYYSLRDAAICLHIQRAWLSLTILVYRSWFKLWICISPHTFQMGWNPVVKIHISVPRAAYHTLVDYCYLTLSEQYFFQLSRKAKTKLTNHVGKR